MSVQLMRRFWYLFSFSTVLLTKNSNFHNFFGYHDFLSSIYGLYYIQQCTWIYILYLAIQYREESDRTIVFFCTGFCPSRAETFDFFQSTGKVWWDMEKLSKDRCDLMLKQTRTYLITSKRRWFLKFWSDPEDIIRMVRCKF